MISATGYLEGSYPSNVFKSHWQSQGEDFGAFVQKWCPVHYNASNVTQPPPSDYFATNEHYAQRNSPLV